MVGRAHLTWCAYSPVVESLVVLLLGRDERHFTLSVSVLSEPVKPLFDAVKVPMVAMVASVLLSGRAHCSLDGSPTGIERAALDRSGAAEYRACHSRSGGLRFGLGTVEIPAGIVKNDWRCVGRQGSTRSRFRDRRPDI
jgi:hypothetical protein